MLALACAGVLIPAGVAAADVTPVAVTATLDFGRAVVGSGTYSKLVEFYNGTGSSFQLISPRGAMFGDFTVGDAGTCPRPPSSVVLAPGGTCNVTVRYTPAASGPQAVTASIALCPIEDVAIVKDADGNPLYGICPSVLAVAVPFAVTGSGAGADTVSVGPDSVSFGSVPAQHQSVPQSVTVTNGSESTAIAGLSKSGPAAGDFVVGTDTCTGAVLAPHETCTFNVLFTPSQAGERNAAVQVNGGTLGNAYPSVSLSGAGTAAASGPHDPPALQAPPVRLDLVTCKAMPKAKGHRSSVSQCRVTLLSRPPKSGSRTANGVTLSRGSRVFATGSGSSSGGALRLLLHPVRPLRAGLYTLTFHRGHARVTRRVRIAP